LQPVIEGILNTGEVMLVGGSRGSGKTAFTAWMAKAVTTGQPFLGHRTHRPTAWLTAITDRSPDVQREWWQRAGLNGGPGPYYCMTEDVTPKQLADQSNQMQRTQGVIDVLCYILDKLAPPKGAVVNFDVINPFAGNVGLGYMNGFTHGWSIGHEARSRDIAIIGDMHGGKPKRYDNYPRLTDRIIANSGFLGTVDTVSYLATYSETRERGHQEFVWEPHLGPGESFLFKRTDEGLFGLVDRKELAQVEQAVQTIEDENPRFNLYLGWIPPEGSDVYISTAVIKERAQKPPLEIAPRTVDRDLAIMEDRGLLVRFQGERGKWQHKVAAES
jgi:hypothetical protein